MQRPAFESGARALAKRHGEMILKGGKKAGREADRRKRADRRREKRQKKHHGQTPPNVGKPAKGPGVGGGPKVLLGDALAPFTEVFTYGPREGLQGENAGFYRGVSILPKLTYTNALRYY